MNQVRFAFRSLRKSPVVTLAAVLSLALGIGANAGIFSIFERLVLRPLPVAHPDELVNLAAPGPRSGWVSTSTPGDVDSVFSYPQYKDLSSSDEARQVLTGLAAHVAFQANLSLGGETTAGSGLLVSGTYFPVLGLEPTAGRLLDDNDDRVVGGQSVAVLSHDFWMERAGGDPAVVGRTLLVNAKPLEVVGVAPPRFEGTTQGQDPDIFVPITLRAELVFGLDHFEERRAYWMYLFGRLAPGVSPETAQTALNRPFRAMIRDVELPLQEGMSEQGKARFAAKEIVLAPGRRGQSTVQEEIKTPLLLLLCVTGFVLLIACANLANLLLVRAADRSGEIAVRLALGASRLQVAVLLLTESLLLATAGGLAGLAVAKGTLALFLSLLPADQNLGLTTELGPAVFASLAVLSLLTALVGLLPASRLTRRNVTARLRGQSGRGDTSPAARRLRSTLATVEIALAMALLVSAGLFARSLANVHHEDLGLDVQRVASFGLSPQLNGYETAESLALYDRLLEEIEAVPGVSRAAVSRVPLLAGNNWGSSLSVEGFEDGPDVDSNASFNTVSPGFFATLGIPILSGRDFTTADGPDSPRVAIVNEAFLRKFGLDRNAVGKRMAQSTGDAVELDIEIVGIAADAKYSEVKDDVPPMFYLATLQGGDAGVNVFYVRTEGRPETVLSALREIVQRADPNLPVEELGTLEIQMRENVLVDRLLTTLSTAFAVLATLLAAIGLYGVIAYSVAQRTREIGLRSALGADRHSIQRLILRQVAGMVLVGGVLGLMAALGLGHLMGSLLFGLEGHDPLVLLLATLLLVVVAFTAGLGPALRASRIDPMIALRAE